MNSREYKILTQVVYFNRTVYAHFCDRVRGVPLLHGHDGNANDLQCTASIVRIRNEGSDNKSEMVLTFSCP